MFQLSLAEHEHASGLAEDTGTSCVCIVDLRVVHSLNYRSYIHACELGGDGNHGLQKKRKRDDPSDMSLAPGQGYFVDARKMKDYMEDIQSEPPVGYVYP